MRPAHERHSITGKYHFAHASADQVVVGLVELTRARHAADAVAGAAPQTHVVHEAEVLLVDHGLQAVGLSLVPVMLLLCCYNGGY